MNPSLELSVLMYHYVRDAGDAAEGGTGIPGLPVREFEAQLDELSKRYTFVTWLQVRAALLDGQPLPPAACLLTFDDGVCDHYINVFRILRDRNLSGLFFIMDRSGSKGLVLAHKIHFLLAKVGVHRLRSAILVGLNSTERQRFTEAESNYQVKYSPASVDGQINLLKYVLQRDMSMIADELLGELFELYVGPEDQIAQDYYLTAQQIHEMAAGGMHFGGHSRSHPWFDWIDSGSREAEIQASAACLREVEPGPWAFAYPYGGLSEDSPSLLNKHGFAAAFTTHAQVKHSDPYFIGRLDGEELTQVGDRYG